jgi:hydroxymethylpyrimidine/phosphomethylpyrimidine kinase
VSSPIPRALTIAGSDSGGGAGIQADLKTFAALGVFGTSAITALTAQNTQTVTAIHEVTPEMVVAQIEAIAQDFELAAAKTGMLFSARVIEAVAEAVTRLRIQPLVVDPVMVSKSGAHLLQPEAIGALRTRLLPRATVVTPNLPEAEVLVGHPIGRRDSDLEAAALEIVAMGPRAVVIKGGHREGDSDDLLFDGDNLRHLRCERIASRNTHGTGCTFSAAIAALLARGRTLDLAVAQAKDYVTEALQTGLSLGHGHGPLHHFHLFYGSEGLP